MEITVNLTAEQVKQLDIAVRRYDPNAGDVYCSLCGISQQGKPTHADDCVMQQFWTSAALGEYIRTTTSALAEGLAKR